MADGVFNIPMSEYYSKSSEFKTKVSEFVTSVETNFINKVSGNIHLLASEDASVVEGFASYTEAKSKLETLKEYETKLTNMSSEGGSNPLNGVVSLDKQYSGEFSSIGQGLESKDVANAISAIDKNITSQSELLNAKAAFLDFVSSLTGIGEKETIANILGLDANDLGTWAKNFSKTAKNMEDFSRLFDTLYTGSGKGISFQTLLYSKEIGAALQSSPLVEKILTFMMDAPYTLKTTKWAGKLAKVLSPISKGMKNIKTGASFLLGEYATGVGNVAKDVIKSDKLKLGGEIVAWGVLGIEEGVNIYKNYKSSDTDSKTGLGKVGKAVLGGTIDTISNVGPLDGMWLGAKIGAGLGGPQGAVIGSIAGVGIGTFNLVTSAVNPEFKKGVYNSIKGGAFAIIDFAEDSVETVGKGIKQGMDTIKSVGNQVSNLFNGGMKTVSSWFG